MTDTVTISLEEYNEYLELKSLKEEAHEHVDDNLNDLKEGKIYDL